MYTDYFQLSEPPFSLTPDPRYLYMSERHREGLAHLLYGVQQPGGFVQLTGDIGSGKTTLCRCLVRQLPPETDVALILNPRLTVIELLATVCDELGIPYPAETGSVKVLIDALNQRLLESHARGRRTVLIIDEAQNLHEDVLEQIRLLTNLETAKEKLLQIILIGQPELLSVLRKQKLRQLAQRITARYHLLALSRQETYAYIQHRLLVSGRKDPLFTKWAMRLVYRISDGVPRVINIICDRALLGAYALDKRRISARIVRQASRETRGILSWRKRFGLARPSAFLALAVLIIGAAILLKPINISSVRQNAEALIESGAKINTEKAALPNSIAPQSASRTILPDPVETVTSKTPNINALAPMREEIAKPGEKSNPVPRLVDILADASLPGKSESSFAKLFKQWGIKLPSNRSDIGCKAARSEGFDCLIQAGNWLKVRRYDVPAILDIVLPDGAKRQVLIVGLANEMATLAIGGQEYKYPIADINQVWDGSFTILWKPPFVPHQISIGDTGKNVVWIRQALDTVDGRVSSSSNSELFDEELRQRVIAFQRSQSLIQDGFVGNETLVRLAIALQGRGAPSLSRRSD